MALVVDSGGVYALYDRRDRHHASVAYIVKREKEPLHVPSPLLGEIGYMLSEWLGSNAVLQFLDDIEKGAFHVQPFLNDDLSHCRQILKDYSDLNVGLCDASVVATAERLGVDRILTVDQRHFRVICRSGRKPYTLLPADLR